MSKEEQELLLTTARILRAHLKDTADSSPVKYDTIIQDVRDLNLALRAFESNVTALHPDTDEDADAAEQESIEHMEDDVSPSNPG